MKVMKSERKCIHISLYCLICTLLCPPSSFPDIVHPSVDKELPPFTSRIAFYRKRDSMKLEGSWQKEEEVLENHEEKVSLKQVKPTAKVLFR